MPERIRVLFVDHETRLSGGQQDLLDLAVALDPVALDLHVALPENGPLEQALRATGVTPHRLPMADELRRTSRWDLARRPSLALRRAGAFAAASWRLAALIRRVRPDIVHTNSMKAHLLAMVPAKLSDVPLIWHVRDILEPGRIRTSFAALGAAFPSRIVCLSKVAAEQFDGSRARSKVRVVYNGIRLGRFAAPPASGWRRRVGVPDGAVLVGMVGQLAHWKGQDVFIEAAAKVLASHPETWFAVVGECLFPENEAAFADEVRARARDLGVDDHIVWSGWAGDVENVIAALDILVHASRLPEPFGRVIVEGMAAGKPVVASRAGAGPEILPPDAGRLVPAGDAGALADALIELIRDDEARRRCGAAAREAARRFDIAETARGVMAVYEEALRCA